jgi:AmiR/NasT family two-component response regulator
MGDNCHLERLIKELTEVQVHIQRAKDILMEMHEIREKGERF